jgi:hypothetical protein
MSTTAFSGTPSACTQVTLSTALDYFTLGVELDPSQFVKATDQVDP